MTETRRREIRPAEERRRQILDAALDLFEQRGFHETTVQDIAAAAGVATGSVYIHFASKQDLLVALGVRFHDGLQSCVADVVEDAMLRMAAGERVTFRESLFGVIDAVAQYSVSNSELCQVAATHLPHRELVRAELEFVEFMARVFEQGVEAGLIHTPDPEMAAYLTNAAISGTLMSCIAYRKPPDLDRLVAATKQLLYRALGPEDGE